MGAKDYHALYTEIQPFSQFWISLSVISAAGFTWFLFINQIILATPLGDYPLPDGFLWIIFIIFGVTIPLVIYSIKLVVEVRIDRLLISFYPLLFRNVYYRHVDSIEVITYDPHFDYGGWGVKWMPGKGWAYTTNGLRGVLITLRDGKRILIGSRSPEKLFEALRDRIRHDENN